MQYVSTRNKNLSTSGLDTIINGIPEDGGLFVPESFPVLRKNDVDKLCSLSYQERTAYILNLFLDEFDYTELLSITELAYASFEMGVVPLVNVDEGLNFLELWHGLNYNSKDLVFSMLPLLLKKAKEKKGLKEISLFLIAESFCTNKAILEGFKNIDGTAVMALYHEKGFSNTQKLQMQTIDGENVCAKAVKGNFDDVQQALNSVFGSAEINQTLKNNNIVLNSINSVTWGSLLPQICYYVSAYIELLNSKQISTDDYFNVVIPIDDFGDVLSCVYAKKMGIPVNNIICASNEKNILTDFFNTGVYDTKRANHGKTSPSISKHIEALLFELFADDKKVIDIMNSLDTVGKFTIDVNLLIEKLPYVFVGFATDDEITEIINVAEEEFDYIADTKTAAALSVYDDYCVDFQDETLTVIVSPNSPFASPSVVLSALTGKTQKDETLAIRSLSDYTGLAIPEQLEKIATLPINFKDFIDKNDVSNSVLEFANSLL